MTKLRWRRAIGRYPGFPLAARIFGVMDFKWAGYLFFPDFAIRQALLVDSRAEKTRNVARLQISQTSLPIRQIRAGVKIGTQGSFAPTREEAFRVRLSFRRLKTRCRWRVQHLDVAHF